MSLPPIPPKPVTDVCTWPRAPATGLVGVPQPDPDMGLAPEAEAVILKRVKVAALEHAKRWVRAMAR